MFIQGAGSCDVGVAPSRSLSEPTLSGLLSIAQLGRLWATSGNLLISDDVKSVPAPEVRRVAFQPLVRVVLIPSRKEYAAADLLVTLWWEEQDYASFKSAAVLELKKLMVARNIRSSKEAIKILYQPDHDSEEEYCAVTASAEEISLQVSSPMKTVIASSGEQQLDNINMEKKAKMGLIEARTDVDLTDLRRHNRLESDAKTIHVHPLAYMCQ